MHCAACDAEMLLVKVVLDPDERDGCGPQDSPSK
jgi:hypothetical protein